MNTEARKALTTIRWCIDRKRYRMLPHFRQRMALRGLVWGDILAVIDDPAEVRDGGLDRYDRPKWLIGGAAADGLPVEFVCVLDHDEQGHAAVFITMY
jgi:hypothetical protein